MNKVKFFCICGLPCSGKSTKSEELANQYNATIFSSDALRDELFGDVTHQDDNDKLFKELHKRIKECLRNGKSAIYDACNISYKRRMAFLQELKNIPCEKICVLMAVPYEECLRRNAERERKVPEYVIKRMYMNFNVPYYYEGFQKIHVINDFKYKYGNVVDVIYKSFDYDQGNSHHTMTLGQHLLKAYDLYCQGVGKIDNTVAFATALHDMSKPFCRTNVNIRGIDDGNAHYYSHQFVSSYDSLFICHMCDSLDVAVRIMWHMQPYFCKEQKTIDKYRRLWGENLYQDIMIIHDCDVNAH